MRDIASHYKTLITFSVLSKRRVYLNDFCGKMNFIYVTHVTFLGVTYKADSDSYPDLQKQQTLDL